MARWVLFTTVAFLASWLLPTGGNSNQPTTQIQTQRQNIPSLFSAQPLTVSSSLMQIQYGSAKIMDQCNTQPNVIWCVNYREFHQPLTEETIKTADMRVRANFTYTPDVVDNWRAHSHAVLNSRPWEGDCDDLSTTALDMLGRQGQPLDRMWLVLVAAQTGNRLGGRLDHLIGVVEDDAGKFWVVGDTSHTTVELKEMTYRPLVYMSAADQVWHEAEAGNRFALQFGVDNWLEVWNSRNGEAGIFPGTNISFPDEVPVLIKNR